MVEGCTPFFGWWSQPYDSSIRMFQTMWQNMNLWPHHTGFGWIGGHWDSQIGIDFSHRRTTTPNHHSKEEEPAKTSCAQQSLVLCYSLFILRDSSGFAARMISLLTCCYFPVHVMVYISMLMGVSRSLDKAKLNGLIERSRGGYQQTKCEGRWRRRRSYRNQSRRSFYIFYAPRETY